MFLYVIFIIHLIICHLISIYFYSSLTFKQCSTHIPRVAGFMSCTDLPDTYFEDADEKRSVMCDVLFIAID